MNFTGGGVDLQMRTRRTVKIQHQGARRVSIVGIFEPSTIGETNQLRRREVSPCLAD